jgi:two-component system chemotaxis sensor kinase CheA
MAADPYRYFRIEARELTDQLTASLSGLVRGAPTAEVVGMVLRHAHTLKGASRVVGQTGIADCAHALEELLEPFRGSSERIGEDPLDRMQALVDTISAAIAALDEQPAEPKPAPVAEIATPPATPATPTAPAAPAAPHHEPTETTADVAPTARASLAEIDAVIEGVLQARGQLSVLRAGLEQITQIRARLHENPGPRPIDRLRKIADLELASEQVQRVLTESTDRIDRELRTAHDTAERLRLVPVESIVPDLERSARDVAAAQGKRVLVDVTGGRMRLDAPVLAAAQAALRQIVRNAVAHGIETPPERLAAGKAAAGRVRVDVVQNAGTVVFSCTDDGRGIDLTAVREVLGRTGRPAPLDDDQVLDQLMRGGISTASTVSEISGRGIGLDVLRDAARQLGGRVSIRTSSGRGTTIDLTTPLSLTAQDVILIDAGGGVALPLNAVRQTLRVPAGEITYGPRGETLIHDGRILPFLPLPAALGDTDCTSRSHPAWSVLLLDGPAAPDGSSTPVAIGVRRLIGTASIAIRALPPLTPPTPLVAGVWIDIDDRPRLVLDPGTLAGLAVGRHASRSAVPAPRAPILVVDDSLTTRMLEQSILESAGYQVELASSAEEGLELATKRPFSLVLVDVEMPGMDGFAFVEQTRARPELRHLPCILVTSRASAADRQRGVEAGARAHLDKGEFYQGTLLDRIAELLAE